MNDSARLAWRRGIAPVLTTHALEALRDELVRGGPRLARAWICYPRTYMGELADWPPESADPIGFCGWQGEGLDTVAEVEEFFCRVAAEADKLMSESGVVHNFSAFWDDTEPALAVAELLAEVELVLAERSSGQEQAVPA